MIYASMNRLYPKDIKDEITHAKSWKIYNLKK